jgi:iron complex transport system substrate-binding protein
MPTAWAVAAPAGTPSSGTELTGPTQAPPGAADARKADAEAGSDGGPVVLRNITFDVAPNVQTFTEAPKRVVSVNGSATELLLALGLEERIAGIAFQDNPVLPEYREAFSRLRLLSNRFPGRETVLSLEPDLIVGWYSAFAPQALGDTTYWNGRGVGTYIMLDSAPVAKSLDNILADIENIGMIFRKGPEARAITDDIRGAIASARTRHPGPAPRALFLEPYPGGRIRTWGADSTLGIMFAGLGGENPFRTTAERGKESYIAAMPDAVVIVYMDNAWDEALKLKESFLTDPLLSRLPASRSGRIGFLPLSECYAPGVRLGMGIRHIEEIVFGGADGDIRGGPGGGIE